ncbi:alpha/beta hydrolase [Paractinoplanes globisporus]|uniref:Alpha/beta hydrolase n=1 Tax=Paractinoplanes globisporus TaxID=113565 RepID=A0ABW6WM03_9ACTN|nr:alpha/beta hydrolase [Actinoplanes globisporus]
MKSLLTVLLAAALPLPAPIAPIAPTPPTPPAADGLDWHSCGDNVECATLTVPADWNDPGGATVDLPVARRPATDRTHRVGTLVFGPGGPWDSGVARVTTGSGRFSDTLRSRFDIVSFDPRGSRGGRPIPCDTSPAGPKPEPVLTSQAEFDATVAYNRKVRDICARSPADMLSNVRDVDALRAALGEKQISFHGTSYGTLLGEQYAERYPGRVRAMVLESVDDHSVPTTAAFLATQAAAFEDAFQDFAHWCDISGTTCTLNARGGARTVWHRLITTYNHFDLDATALVRLKDADYATLDKDLAAVDDGTPPRHVTDLGVVVPAFCDDWSLPVRDYAEYASLLRRTAAIAKDTGYPPQVFALTMCLGRPQVTNPQHVLRVHTRTPILLLNSRHDPATGLNWARSVERQLGRHGVLVTYDGAGHGAYTISECMKRTADDYLVSLEVPARGTTCPTA